MRARSRRTSIAAMSDRCVAIAVLLVLSAIGAELLAAYDDSTGRPLELLFSVAFFAALYGCPALLIRELARRSGRGWPAMLALAAAAGLLQAGVIDQSLFADEYGEVRGWEEARQATYLAPLGISAHMALNFVLGHVLFSFCAPIAVAEALRPELAHRPWLRRRGIVTAGAAWALVAAMILADERHATGVEVAVTLAVVAALAGVALGRRGVRRRDAGDASPPRVRIVLVLSFVLAATYSAAPETWLGVALTGAVLGIAATLLVRSARVWRLEHVAAATGVLLARGALAFTYYPVVGHTSAAQKYAHNVVMLAIVVAAGAYAVRCARLRALPSCSSRSSERSSAARSVPSSG
jgi:hypothetical protein